MQQHPTLAPSVKQLALDSVFFSVKSWNSFFFLLLLFFFFPSSLKNFSSPPLFFLCCVFRRLDILCLPHSSVPTFLNNHVFEVTSSNRTTSRPQSITRKPIDNKNPCRPFNSLILKLKVDYHDRPLK